jgi:hypothetical protein
MQGYKRYILCKIIPFFLFLLFGPLLECISRDEVYYHNIIISIQLLDLKLTRNLTLTSQK